MYGDDAGDHGGHDDGGGGDAHGLPCGGDDAHALLHVPSLLRCLLMAMCDSCCCMKWN